ncbi:TPA: hypothetical protein ACPYU1_002792 [Raoultella planticola]
MNEHAQKSNTQPQQKTEYNAKLTGKTAQIILKVTFITLKREFRLKSPLPSSPDGQPHGNKDTTTY